MTSRVVHVINKGSPFVDPEGELCSRLILPLALLARLVMETSTLQSG